MAPITRRTFLAGSAAAAAIGAAPAGREGKPLRLGGPVFVDEGDPRELARAHRQAGWAAGYCPDVEPDDPDRIQAIREGFEAEDITIAEVGAWVNMLDPDSEQRRKNLDYVARRLAVADEVGARCCVNIAGSYHPEVWYGPHPKNLSQEFFDRTVENCRTVIDRVRPKRTKFTIEMMGWAIPDNPDDYLALVKAVDREAFGVHIDVCNGINQPARFYQNSRFIRDCFRKLGPSVVSCHAKDLSWEVGMQIHFVEVVPGRGRIDYRAYLQELAKLPGDIPLMLEHLETAEEYAEGGAYIKKVGRKIGLTFA